MPARTHLGGWLTLALLVVAGCANQSDVPRDRYGSLPFPGMLSLYQVADPNKLGEHQSSHNRRLFAPDESRGIIYTKRAGFLDLAHIHITVDTVRYCTTHIRAAIEDRDDVVTLSTIEGSTFYVVLRYPPDWPDKLQDEQAIRVADELAIRTGQRVAYVMMTWHELITWFGYRTLPFFDEAPSAFTYDDPMSHIVGLMVAGRVLRQPSARSFDEDVTRAINGQLAALGAVSPRQTEQAVRAVDGVWWSRGAPRKRQVEAGVADGVIRPWLVPSVHSARQTTRDVFCLPSLDDVYGRDFSDFYSVTIDPQIAQADRIRDALSSRHDLLSAEHDLPELMQVIRWQMQEQFAMDVDRPWPAARATDGPVRLRTMLTAPEVTMP